MVKAFVVNLEHRITCVNINFVVAQKIRVISLYMFTGSVLMMLTESHPVIVQLKSIAIRVPNDAADSLKALQSHSERFLTGQGIHPPEVTGAGRHATAHQRSASMGSLVLFQDGSTGNAGSSAASLTSESPCHRIMENSSRANGDFAPKLSTHGEVQLIEQFEPGVYVTLIQLRDGTKVFKRVRFR